MVSLIGQTISHYKVLEHLGGGGLGVVYKAEDTKLKRTVALKFLPSSLTTDPDAKERFSHEAQAASALQHTNICTVHDIDESPDGQLFIVMDLYEGETLKKKIEHGPVPVDTAVDIAYQVAQGLARAHEAGIIHRDIKPANIMVTNRGEVKIVDFGLAKLSGRTLLTKTGTTMGTAAYMSPEQARSESTDNRTDIWSLGVVLYEMLTGKRPFESDYEQALVYSLLNEEPKAIRDIRPDVPEALEKISRRAMAKELKDRYQASTELIADLESYRAGTQLSKKTRKQPTKKRKALHVGTAAVAILCVISILLLLRTSPVRVNPNWPTSRLDIPFREILYPSLSRDGNWVAFAVRDDEGKSHVHWMSLTSGTQIRVTDESYAWIEAIDLSPDASQIVYDCIVAWDTPMYKIKIVPSQGRLSQTLTDTGFCAKWRPDGQRIGYLRAQQPSGYPSASGKFEIWSIKPDRSDNHLEFTDSLHAFPGRASFCWSPDGKSMAWVRNYSQTEGDVMVRELATGRERQLTFDREKIDEVNWASNNVILFVSGKSGSPNLWMIPAAGGEATAITHGDTHIYGARISADNRTLVYLELETISHLWTSALDGSDARKLTSSDASVHNARFSPDGNHISYVGLAGGFWYGQEAHLYVTDRDGKDRTQLTPGSVPVLGSRWSPDGKWLAYSSRSPAEPADSARVYLIQPVNPGVPRLLCKGRSFEWADSDRVVAYDGRKTVLYSTKGGTPTQVYHDSTFAVPIQGGRQLLFRDHREGRWGTWVVSLDALGRQNREAKKIVPFNTSYGLPPDRRFVIYQKQGDELWRVWLSSGKEERIGKALPGGPALIQDISTDGKKILWIMRENRSKLVLVKNVFE